MSSVLKRCIISRVDPAIVFQDLEYLSRKKKKNSHGMDDSEGLMQEGIIFFHNSQQEVNHPLLRYIRIF